MMTIHKQALQDTIKALKHALKTLEEIDTVGSEDFGKALRKRVEINDPYEEMIMSATMKTITMGTLATMMKGITLKNMFKVGAPDPRECDNDCENCETSHNIDEEMKKIIPQKKRENNLYS